ncbi:MAG: hypothetical protein K6E78_10545, partial [Treponema sp.]|nr:hypothetical protein [Treponema sp.]
ISANLPIKEGQFIRCKFISCGVEVSPIGKIVRSRKTIQAGLYNLHIHFSKIDMEEQNKILAKVYGYE